METKLKKVRINRRQWLQGITSMKSGTPMYDPTNDRSCCWGHAISQIGDIPRHKLHCNSTVRGFVEKPGMRNYNDDILKLAYADLELTYELNDGQMPRKEKEPMLIKEFRKFGIELEFYGN